MHQNTSPYIIIYYDRTSASVSKKNIFFCQKAAHYRKKSISLDESKNTMIKKIILYEKLKQLEKKFFHNLKDMDHRNM